MAISLGQSQLKIESIEQILSCEIGPLLFATIKVLTQVKFFTHTGMEGGVVAKWSDDL